jgi:hypothetical protein
MVPLNTNLHHIRSRADETGASSGFHDMRGHEHSRRNLTAWGIMDGLGGVSGTWVKEYDGFEASILVVINLQFLEG